MNLGRQKTSWFQRLFGRRIFLVLNLVILVFLFFSFGREFAGNWEIKKEIKNLETRAQNLRAEHIEIEQLVSLAQTESFLEKEARLKLGMNKPGEQVVIIEDQQPVLLSSSATINSNDQILSGQESVDSSPVAIANPLKWWYYFFDTQKFLSLKYYGK